MGGSAWLDMQSVIQDQLSLQVRLSYDRHHAFMAAHGLGRVESVADLGTGDGLFLSCLARDHPAVRFCGIDDKPHMIKAARAREATNVDWVLADALAPETRERIGRAGGVLMRYFILHLPGTREALGRILRRARLGTRLWVFDLDTDHSRCLPPHPAYASFTGLVRGFCEKDLVEIRTGAMLPPILEGLGWETEDVSVEPFNNQEVDPALFAEYILREATLYHTFLHGSARRQELSPLREFLQDPSTRASHLVQYGMVMLCAVKRG